MSSEAASPEQRVLLRVVTGEPTEEELAALVTLLAVRHASAAPARSGAVRRSGWTDRARGLRGTHVHGPSGWRAAALPR